MQFNHIKSQISSIPDIMFFLNNKIKGVNKNLSYKQKLEYLPLLIQRDGGFICFYCKKPLTYDGYIYEHLDDNRRNNEPENIVLAHQSCNKKKETNLDYRMMALNKIIENKNFVREKNCEYTGTKEVSTEIDINVTNFEFTEQFLTERINTDGSIDYKDALDSITYLCKIKTSHGSQPAIRRYIDLLTSSVGPFMITKNENGKKVIVERGGN